MVFSENVRPLWGLWRGRAGDNPEASWLLDNGHLLGLAGGDFPATTQEADLSGFLNDPGVMGREMQAGGVPVEVLDASRCFFRRCFSRPHGGE